MTDKVLKYKQLSADHSESFTYDKMGNMHTLKRYGLKDNNTFGLIDDLTMPKYSGCQLRRVDDAAGDQSASDVMEFKNGYNGSGEYVYHNGKIYSDFNKKICSTRYNYLVLPSRVQFRYGHQIDYAYDAAGVKRSVTHKESGQDMNFGPYEWYPEVPNNKFILATKTDYVGSRIYEDDVCLTFPCKMKLVPTLKRILTEEGYIDKTGSNYSFHFYLKDHLGNVRVVLDENGDAEQITNYYPSGTVLAEHPRRTDQGVQPYKFGTKELDRSNGLDFYDFEARNYNSALMRFTTPDPLREKYYGISPFVYCLNNPLRFIDPDGRDIILFNVTHRNNSGRPDGTRGEVSAKTNAALKDLLRTKEGRSFFGQFAKAGDVVGGHKFNQDGKYSSINLTIFDYSWEKETGNIIPSETDGSISVSEDKVTLKISSYGQDKNDIGETLTHETQLHGTKAGDQIEGKKVSTEDQDHNALKNKNSKHQGYNNYDSVRKQLEVIDENYKESFKKAEEHAKRNY